MQITQNKLYRVISFTSKWLHFYDSNTFKGGVVHSRVFKHRDSFISLNRSAETSVWSRSKPATTTEDRRPEQTSVPTDNVTHQVTISLIHFNIYTLHVYTLRVVQWRSQGGKSDAAKHLHTRATEEVYSEADVAVWTQIQSLQRPFVFQQKETTSTSMRLIFFVLTVK